MDTVTNEEALKAAEMYYSRPRGTAVVLPASIFQDAVRVLLDSAVVVDVRRAFHGGVLLYEPFTARSHGRFTGHLTASKV